MEGAQQQASRASHPPQIDRPNGLVLPVKRGILVLLAISGGLMALSLLTRLSGLGVSRLDADQEISVPTLWSTLQLSLLCCVLGLRGACAKVWRERFEPWFLLVALVGFVTIDEALQVHEALIEPVRLELGTSGLLHLAWIIPYGLLTLVVAAVMFPWIRSLERTLRSRLVLAAAVFVTGAIGAEAVGGWLIDNGHFDSIRYTLVTTVEESLEMLGVVIAIAAVVRDMTARGSLNLRLQP